MPLPAPRDGLFQVVQEEVLASAARTVTGAATFPFVGPAHNIVFEIVVTAASGTTPTLDVDLQDSFDGTNWNKVADINAANITTTGRTVGRLSLTGTPMTGTVRLAWTIGGTTPSFTFSVNAYIVRSS